MPCSTDSTRLTSLSTNTNYTDASTLVNSNNPIHLRPKSAKSTRSPSPFLNRWGRLHAGGKENEDPAHQQQHGQPQPHPVAAAEVFGRKSTSSSFMSSSTGPRTDNIKKRDSQSGLPPPLTTEEFEALPVAIQRKYFSTLERLRFAQPSAAAVDGIFDHYCQTSKRRRPRQDRSVSDHFPTRIRRRSVRDSRPLSPESLAFANNLPDKIKRRQFTREEQVVLARHLRASVILDAADEAVYKIGRGPSRRLSPDLGTITSATDLASQRSMESLRSIRPEGQGQGQPRDNRNLGESRQPEAQSDVPESFYDSFRWLEEEEDLDLRLFLDDYHANLREALPTPTKDRRPSFRRHLSISKIPFGRSSLSSSRPATKDASHTPTGPLSAPPMPLSNGFNLPRRRSRTMSLITPRHGHTSLDSISPIDPAAAHYQDPEARLKLRVYLASPQKFDEAIEFGFPSAEALSAAPVIKKGALCPQKRQSRQKLSEDSSKFETFLADDDDDDKLSNSDQVSMADPDSPRTPHSLDKPTIRPTRLPTYTSHSQKPSDGYVHVPASSREMTLRMTLTRPDLRACEDNIYGWQQQAGQPQGQPAQQVRKSQSTMLRDELSPAVYIGDAAGRKESIEKQLASIDRWGAEADRGMMKRIWNRVRRA